MSESDWKRFEKEGDQLYDYLISHFEDMFEPTGRIKNYDMRYTSYLTSGYYEGVNKECGEQVHQEIIPWIREEHRSGRLFSKENWKPFRDQLTFTKMYYGYRKLFFFHDFFYFQLTMEHILYDTEDRRLEASNDFQVALYGWKEKGVHNMQPDDNIILQDDLMMPEIDWIYK